MKACDPILILLALVFPPLPIAILTGYYSPELFLSIFFTISGFLPGVCHAIWLILSPKARPEKLTIREIREADAQRPPHNEAHLESRMRKSNDTISVDEKKELDAKWTQ